MYRPATHIDLQIQFQQIQDAVASVTQTLRSSAYPALFMNHVDDYPINNDGTNQNILSLWPSPYRTLDSKNVSPNQPLPPNSANSMIQHHTHMSSVCASIEKFANDVIQPAILTELGHTLVVDVLRTGRDSSNSNVNTSLDNKVGSSRAFFGTLLLLRELLIQNIHAIFGPSVMMSLSNNTQQEDGPSSLPTNDTKPASVSLSLSEVQEFEKQIFVSAIILTGLQNVATNGHQYKCNDGSNKAHTAESMMDAFLCCMDMYEYVAFDRKSIYVIDTLNLYTLTVSCYCYPVSLLMQPWTCRLFGLLTST